MDRHTEIKAKIRTTLAKDFQGEVLHKVGTPVELACEVNSNDIGHIIITIPDPVGLFLNKAESLIDSAEKIKSNIIAQKRYKYIQKEKINNYLQSAMGAYIFLAAALESFLNMTIPHDYIYKHEKKGDLDKKAIQRELNIYRKIDIAVETYNSKIKENSVLWGSITNLLDIRGEIVHLKDLNPVDQGSIFAKIFDTKFDNLHEGVNKLILSIRPNYFD